MALVIASVLILTGCGTSKKSGESTKSLSVPTIPTSCTSTMIIEALPTDIRAKSSYIPTQWTPASGTDLEAVINNKGIACSYGISSQEVGVTIYWVKDQGGLFESRIKGWTDLGMRPATISGATKAYAVVDQGSLNPEIHSYAIEMLYQGVWIHIGSTYMYTQADAQPMIEAAINSLS